jgi:hypothetical protein
MNIDIHTKTVEWVEQPFINPPPETRGVFHQFWKHNLTAFSMTAGLNQLSFPLSASCGGSRIVTYDYVNQQYEITTPGGGNWGSIAGGACGRYKDDVYCYGGFSCSNFKDSQSWTKYNIPMNIFTRLDSTRLGSMVARSMSSVTCFENKQFCLIGSGNSAAGGTRDQWDIYDIDDDEFDFITSANKPQNIEYLTPDNHEIWRINNGDFEVAKDIRKLLVIGGDNASGAIGTSNTVRYVAEYDVNSKRFNKLEVDLFTIKQQYFRNIPSIRCQGDNPGYECEEEDDEDDCSYFVEFGGFEQNADVTLLTYPNKVVLYKWC